MAPECASCHSLVAEGEGLALWDGRLHCPRCLDGLPEPVLQYFRYHGAFDEHCALGDVLWESVRYSLITALIFSSVCFLSLAWLGGGRLGPAEVVRTLLVLLILCGIMLVFYACTDTVMAERGAHRVLIRNGHIEVRWHTGRSFTIPLTSITWHIGTTKEDQQFAGVRHRPHRAIVLVVPTSRRWRPPCRVCCGMSEESFAALEAFLRLAGVPHVQ